jgi:hypothetical protein
VPVHCHVRPLSTALLFTTLHCLFLRCILFSQCTASFFFFLSCICVGTLRTSNRKIVVRSGKAVSKGGAMQRSHAASNKSPRGTAHWTPVHAALTTGTSGMRGPIVTPKLNLVCSTSTYLTILDRAFATPLHLIKLHFTLIIQVLNLTCFQLN